MHFFLKCSFSILTLIVQCHFLAIVSFYIASYISLFKFNLHGFVGTLKDRYICNILLPRVPLLQSTSLCVTRMNSLHIGYLLIAQIPLWSDFLTKLPPGLSGCNERCNIPFLPVTFM